LCPPDRVGEVTDILARISQGERVETELRRRTADLERANQNLESFTYTVSHDLRAPLRAVSGFSAALLKNCRDSLGETGLGYVERIRDASGQMAELIDDLLDFAHVSQAALRLQTVDLGAEAASIAAALRQSEPGRQVTVTIERPALARADVRLIRTVLQNLLENAWKFTSYRTDASIAFGSMPASSSGTCYYVRDNGAGFDSAYAGKLFTPFQRLHSARDFPGTGIGLASVRQIVERHGGRVWAESAVDAGATFYFTLGEENTGE
jgi:light-regulated signal transduction histidine kinase (bacteriophytochrome)